MAKKRSRILMVALLGLTVISVILAIFMISGHLSVEVLAKDEWGFEQGDILLIRDFKPDHKPQSTTDIIGKSLKCGFFQLNFYTRNELESERDHDQHEPEREPV